MTDNAPNHIDGEYKACLKGKTAWSMIQKKLDMRIPEDYTGFTQMFVGLLMWKDILDVSTLLLSWFLSLHKSQANQKQG